MNAKFVALIAILFTSASVFACRISVKAENEKELYKKGEIVEVIVKVEKTHKNCTNSIENTEYREKNLKILKKGAWTKDENGTYTSKIKVKLTAVKGEKCALAVLRDCSRGDRNSVIYFNIK
jgi:hypothetical protein